MLNLRNPFQQKFLTDWLKINLKSDITYAVTS